MGYQGYEDCFYCGGTGRVPCDCNGGVEGTEDEDCPACGGTGEHICPECNGSGKVRIDR